MKPSIYKLIMVALIFALLGCDSGTASPEGNSDLPDGGSESLNTPASAPAQPSTPSVVGESAPTTL